MSRLSRRCRFQCGMPGGGVWEAVKGLQAGLPQTSVTVWTASSSSYNGRYLWSAADPSAMVSHASFRMDGQVLTDFGQMSNTSCFIYIYNIPYILYVITYMLYVICMVSTMQTLRGRVFWLHAIRLIFIWIQVLFLESNVKIWHQNIHFRLISELKVDGCKDKKSPNKFHFASNEITTRQIWDD